MSPVQAVGKREPDMHDLIPWSYAMRCWQRLSTDARYDPTPPNKGAFDERLRCPVCKYPAGQRGFVRVPFPTGHELFGRAICCPRCWPEPFGNAKTGGLSKNAKKIAAMWAEALALE